MTGSSTFQGVGLEGSHCKLYREELHIMNKIQTSVHLQRFITPSLTFFDHLLVENCLGPFSFEAPGIFSQGHPWIQSQKNTITKQNWMIKLVLNVDSLGVS